MGVDIEKTKRTNEARMIPIVIARAIVSIQKTLKPLTKSETNDEFDSSYVPLDVVTEQALALLAEHGIGVMQPPVTDENEHLALKTILIHKSGVGYSETTRLALGKADPQGHGSAITYMRRYALMGILGLTAKDEDDDGNSSSGRDLKATPEQLDELKGMLRHLKWPQEDIAKEVWRARTRDQAALMIHNYRGIVSQRVTDVEGAEAAMAVESGTDVVVDESSPQATLQARINALGLASPSYQNKLVHRATGKPFMSKVKSDKDLASLNQFLTELETDERALPAEFYAPKEGQQIVVEEDIA